jgi:Bacterial PH domain
VTTEEMTPAFSVFRPATSAGTLFGLGVVGVSAVLSAGLLYRGLTMDAGPGQLLPLIIGGFFVAIGALFAYWTWSCSTLRYEIDRNALSITWGATRQVVPLTRIEKLIPAAEDEVIKLEGVSWRGHHVGRAQIEDVGDVLFYSAHQVPSEVLYVQTPSETYGISLPDHVLFAQTVQVNQKRGPLFEQRQAVHRWGVAAQSFWLDPQARLLALLLLASFIVVLAYVLQTYPGLSPTVSLRFPSLGGIIRVTSKSELLDIPRSAFGLLALNLTLGILLHTWERMVGYVLLLTGIAVQIMLLVGAIVAVA